MAAKSTPIGKTRSGQPKQSGPKTTTPKRPSTAAAGKAPDAKKSDAKAPAKTAEAKKTDTKARGVVAVLGREVYVRTGRKSWVIGTLFGKENNHPNVKHKDNFDAQKGSIKGWAWGRALGNVNRCGYVEDEYLMQKASPHTTDECGHRTERSEENREYLCGAFAVMTNNDDNAGTSVRTKRGTTLFANFDKDKPLDPIFDIPAGRIVGWRWVTKSSHNGHRYVIVNYVVRETDQRAYYKAGTSLWGFVKLADLDDLPGTRPC